MSNININKYFKFSQENESQFISSIRYISVSIKCKCSFSIFYANLLMNICSDIEDILRAYFNLFSKRYNIRDFISRIKSDNNLKKIIDESVEFDNSDYGKITPFQSIQYENNQIPKWWQSYNKIKHDKMKSFSEASQENVLNSLAALYILNRYILISQDCKIDIFLEDKKYFNLTKYKSLCIGMGQIVLKQI